MRNWKSGSACSMYTAINTAVSWFPSNCGTQCYTTPLCYRNEVRADASQSGPHQFPGQLWSAGVGEDSNTCSARWQKCHTIRKRRNVADYCEPTNFNWIEETFWGDGIARSFQRLATRWTVLDTSQPFSPTFQTGPGAHPSSSNEKGKEYVEPNQYSTSVPQMTCYGETFTL